MADNNEETPSEQIGDLFNRLKGSSGHRSHTHQTIDEIVRELRIGPIERLLLWLSKTDYYVLSLSTFHTRLTLASLGMMVMFTSVLAFSSSLYALSATLVSPENSFRWPIILILALIYAFGILIIDREIVGSITKKSLVIRLFFAIFIAMAVSWPVKLKFFEGRTDIEIKQMVAEINTEKSAKIETLLNVGEPERQRRIEEISKRINSMDKEIAILDEEIRRESEDVERGQRCGPRCQQFRSQKDAMMEKRIAAEQELADLSQPGALPERVQAEIDLLRAGMQEIPHDFLTKWEALGRIKRESGAEYQVLSSFLLIFFMLLELVPLMLKWSIGKTEYHYYLESRSNLNNQKIISLTNLFIEAMQKDKYSVLEMIPVEVTDLIAMHIEDEARGGDSRSADLKALAAALRDATNGSRPAENPIPDPQQPSGPAQGSSGQSNDSASDETIDEPRPRT